MVTALRMIGFDKVFDTNYGADLTITEEANELIERIKSGKKMPMATSCCPGWVNYMENIILTFRPFIHYKISYADFLRYH